ncbi:hypothetical protein [Leptobacterium sp. I13]|uniref:hypothetical protein n=1 Tax=Leptobacterium meishanense TaxID=3128904 RepID=UPI0030EF1E7E
MIAKFTEEAQKILFGYGERIGKKHQCSGQYVRLIIKGKRNINTEKAKAIYQELIEIIERKL